MSDFEIVSVTTLDPMDLVVTTLNPLAKAETAAFFNLTGKGDTGAQGPIGPQGDPTTDAWTAALAAETDARTAQDDALGARIDGIPAGPDNMAIVYAIALG